MGAPLFDSFIATGLIASKGEGRRHILAGALKVNDVALSAERPLRSSDLIDGAIKLSIGKKKHALVRAE
jgi:tyrosyl-tRNA synthetase